MGQQSRDVDIQAVFGHLQEVTRRATARSRRLNEPLTFVEYSLIRFIEATPRTRATDIAAAFALNRSTVSRQVNTLIDLGLVRYVEHDDEPGRGRVLDLTDHGRAQLATAVEAQQTAIRDRVQGWTDDEVSAFAASLARFNDDD